MFHNQVVHLAHKSKKKKKNNLDATVFGISLPASTGRIHTQDVVLSVFSHSSHFLSIYAPSR